MARSARVKKPYSTYLISQQCEISIFDSKMTRKAFLNVLVETINKYDCLIIACDVEKNGYRLIVFDNGNDISSIMRSINISLSMKTLNQSIKFCRRFKSTILQDCNAISEYLNTFGNLQNEYCAELLKANQTTTVIKFKTMFFENENEFCRLIAKNCHCLPATVIDCNGMNERPTSIITAKTAKLQLQYMLNEHLITFEDMLTDKKLRNRCILYLRRNSTMTLKQIGELFNLSESAVSKVIKKHCNTQGGNHGTIF